MALMDLITKELIRVPMTATNKQEAIMELVDLADSAGRFTSRDDVLSAVQQREALGSTGLEKGIAIPHAKTEAVKEITLVMGISPNGLDFQALDGNPSKIFFCILAPPDQAGIHIEALSEIAQITKSGAFLRLLGAAEDADEVLELFQED